MAKNGTKKADNRVSAISQGNGRGSRNRTHIDGFGDRSTAFVRYPYHRALLLLHK